jgi:hypothetical protein
MKLQTDKWTRCGLIKHERIEWIKRSERLYWWSQLLSDNGVITNRDGPIYTGDESNVITHNRLAHVIALTSTSNTIREDFPNLS